VRSHGGHDGRADPGGFGGSSFLKDYAVIAIRYVLAVAFKLFVMQLVLGVGMPSLRDFPRPRRNIQDIFVVIGASVVLAGPVKSLPEVCAGIINARTSPAARP
jgi:type IV secretion system protein TrbL